MENVETHMCAFAHAPVISLKTDFIRLIHFCQNEPNFHIN